ncbi:hydrolase [Arabiibacter massiliensis]|uniref:hydrolase n=1 Tax=Arabiibacter massiliensis TaxID=1870985 RepID=UPI0009BC3690|nr:hydrolase [Arabiibacter massiliensis]
MTWLFARIAPRFARAALVAAALAAGLALAPTVFADEPVDQPAAQDDNAVNTQQLPDSSFIYDTSISDLSSADTYYDNQTVQVVGEAVGDSIRSGLGNRHRWITLSAEGDSSTLSVYMTAEQAAKIDAFGKYGTRGTTLQVRGTFHLVCPDHEGLSDLHAEVVTAVAPGEHREDVFDFNDFVPGIAAVAVGLIMLGVFYWLRERQR